MLMKTNFSILNLKVISSNQQRKYEDKRKIYQIQVMKMNLLLNRSFNVLTLIKFVPNLYILQESKHFKYVNH